jgi:hypothetical protein
MSEDYSRRVGSSHLFPAFPMFSKSSKTISTYKLQVARAESWGMAGPVGRHASAFHDFLLTSETRPAIFKLALSNAYTCITLSRVTKQARTFRTLLRTDTQYYSHVISFCL